MGHIAFTVDVDRDVNQAVEGRTAAVSRGEKGDPGYRFDSSLRGLEILTSMFDDLDLSATFFVEGETAENITPHLEKRLQGHEIACHGYGHEDLTGQETGLCLTEEELRKVLKKSRETVERELMREPAGFRAPYLHINDLVLDELEGEFAYDSSLVRSMEGNTIRPYQIRKRLVEMPIAMVEDERGGKMYSYLWPLLEGTRTLSDYFHLLDRFEEGLLVLATHSWHIVETFTRGKLDSQDVINNVRMLREIIGHCRDKGFHFTTLERYLPKI